MMEKSNVVWTEAQWSERSPLTNVARAWCYMWVESRLVPKIFPCILLFSSFQKTPTSPNSTDSTRIVPVWIFQTIHTLVGHRWAGLVEMLLNQLLAKQTGVPTRQHDSKSGNIKNCPMMVYCSFGLICSISHVNRLRLLFLSPLFENDLDMFVGVSFSLKTDLLYFNLKRSTCWSCLLLW